VRQIIPEHHDRPSAISRGLHQVDDRQVTSIIYPRSAVGGCASG
jgi:hypothetical protein